MTNTSRHALEVFFDYTCPFAYRAHRWLDMVDVDPRWRPFSLLEHNYRGDGPPVWRLPERADDISLLLFAGHEWVRDQGADLDAYRHAVFHAWHETADRLDVGDVVGLAIDAGAEGSEETLRQHFLDAESEHDAARAAGVFGSPTLVFAPQRAAFVKLAAVPAAEEADQVLEAAQRISPLASVSEVKRPATPEPVRGEAPFAGLSSR